MNIYEEIKKVVVKQLGVKLEEVTLESSIVDDLGADSLDTVELIMALEERFDIEVPDEDAEKMYKVSDVVSYIENRLKQLEGYRIYGK